MKLNKNSNLAKIRDEMERRLKIMRYSQETIKAYMRIFGCVEAYMKEYGETNYTKELGQRVLARYALQLKQTPFPFKHARNVIRRIDDVLENKQFAPWSQQVKWECPLIYTDLFDKYLESLARRGLRKSTISGRKTYAGRFFSRIPNTVLSLENFSAVDLYEVLTKYEWSITGLITLKSVLSFLFANNIIKTNLSICVPSPTRPSPLPSIYSGEDIQRLLLSVDRTIGFGKRDYAILILSTHMGLRCSDVVNLSFKNIDLTAKTISIIQVKTARPLTLVMNTEVEEAVTDYIQNGRPQASSEKIFVRSRAPYTPLSSRICYGIAHRYFNLAGIASQGRKRGTQALRASYATALVSKGIPYAVVQEALGHAEPESAKHYVRVDVKHLRMCALDVPKPIGSFAVMLEPEVRRTLSLNGLKGVSQ